MTKRVLLIGGTSGLFGWSWNGHTPWVLPGSPFVKALEGHGYRLADAADPFSWTGDLDGLVAGHTDWLEAGKALRWWWDAKGGADAIVAHSHALQVVAHARVPAPALVTVGSPVRADLWGQYAGLRSVVGRWVHLWSPVDAWQILGELRDGAGVLTYRRTLPWAENVCAPGRSHSGLLDPKLWTSEGWFQWLTP